MQEGREDGFGVLMEGEVEGLRGGVGRIVDSFLWWAHVYAYIERMAR